MVPSGIRSFQLELGPGAYHGGELLSGLLVLELSRPLRVKRLDVAARGSAAVHWLDSRSVGVNAVYNDYAAFQSFLRSRWQLLPRGKPRPGPRCRLPGLFPQRTFVLGLCLVV